MSGERDEVQPSGWAGDESYPAAGSAELGQRLFDEGLLFAVNRLVLHPVGLAMAVDVRGAYMSAPGALGRSPVVVGLRLLRSCGDAVEFDEAAAEMGRERIERALADASSVERVALRRLLELVDAAG